MKYSIFMLVLSGLMFTHTSIAAAQESSWQDETQFGVVFGLTQPLVVSGFNIEGVYIRSRMIFNYSHGVSLDFSGDLLPDYLQDQQVVVHMPFSTGFGVGYRFTEWLNVRVEPKWHRFEFYYEGDAQSAANRITSDGYNYSVGLGVYGFFQPFKNQIGALRGVTVAPSIRFWPTVASSFDGNRFEYENIRTGQTEELKTLGSGIGFSPFIVNISVGYVFTSR